MKIKHIPFKFSICVCVCVREGWDEKAKRENIITHSEQAKV